MIYSKNTDGIDPDSCTNVLIEDYVYCGGDDAVAVKSGWNFAGQRFNMSSRNITVRNAVSGCRGGFTIGSEMSGGVSDVSHTPPSNRLTPSDITCLHPEKSEHPPKTQTLSVPVKR